MDIIEQNKSYTIVRKYPGEDSQSPPEGMYCVHRLDKDVSGVMVYAVTAASASKLSIIFSEGSADKEYLAVAEGSPLSSFGTMEDLLFHDRNKNKTYVVKTDRKGVKKASLSYNLLDTIEYEGRQLTLYRVKLHTGRTHQIRVQFASRGMPLAGDGKYGSALRKFPIGLFSESLSFVSPEDGLMKEFRLSPDMTQLPFCLFSQLNK